jgi:prepilin peptidase CpaA
MIYAAAMDVLTLRIANAISMAVVAGFFVVALFAAMPVETMLVHAAVGVAALIAGMVMFQFRLIGGGDAKLLAAAGLWVGYEQLIPFVVWVTIFGGLLSLLALAYRSFPAGAFPLPGWALRLHKSRSIPYGVAISAGALTVYPLTGIPLLLAH